MSPFTFSRSQCGCSRTIRSASPMRPSVSFISMMIFHISIAASSQRSYLLRISFPFVAEAVRRHSVILHEHGAFVFGAETSARFSCVMFVAEWEITARDIAPRDALHRTKRADRRRDRNVGPRPERRFRPKISGFVFGRVAPPVKANMRSPYLALNAIIAV